MLEASAAELQDFVSDTASALRVVGAAAGLLVDGEQHTAFHGVTSVENPLEVNASTLFQFGSTGKTFTATAVLRLVAQGLVDLDAPVRRYLPDLRLRDEDVAARVTVLQLLNHTAGCQGDVMTDTGDGDDCLQRYATSMADLEQVEPLGSTVSYNNASLALAGPLVATVTGQVYEQALQELVLDPLGLATTFSRPTDVMTRRFACGHLVHDDGRVTVARPWSVIPRSWAPAGGLSSTIVDQLAWARLHLGDGTGPDGTSFLPAELLQRMQAPTVQLPAGSPLGDAVGLTWLLEDIDGTRLVSHGGSTYGQYSHLTLVPSRGFAVTCLTNAAVTAPSCSKPSPTGPCSATWGCRRPSPSRRTAATTSSPITSDGSRPSPTRWRCSWRPERST
jgi:CubicO group peptidase (beta-lactamase class C family)